MNNKANGKTGLGLSSFFCPSFPFFHILQGYTRSNWAGDWRSSVNVALLAIPQGMAYALVAGLPIQYGLLGSAFAAIFGGLLGKGRFITLGPTNATAVLLFGVFAGLGMINRSGMGSEIKLFRFCHGFLVFRLVSTARILFAYLVHGSVRFTDRNHSLRNRRRFSDHCQPIQAHPWPWRKGGKKPLPPFGNPLQHLRPAWSSLRTRSMAQPVYGRHLHFAPTHP